MKKLLTISSLFFLISCAAQSDMPERKCEGFQCGSYYKEFVVDDALREEYRLEGKRYPRYKPTLFYPDFLLFQKMEGKVTVALDIDKEGNVTNVKVICSEPNSAFNQYAIEYFQRWKFEASDRDTLGQAQAVAYLQTSDPAKIFTKCSSPI